MAVLVSVDLITLLMIVRLNGPGLFMMHVLSSKLL